MERVLFKQWQELRVQYHDIKNRGLSKYKATKQRKELSVLMDRIQFGELDKLCFAIVKFKGDDDFSLIPIPPC